MGHLIRWTPIFPVQSMIKSKVLAVAVTATGGGTGKHHRRFALHQCADGAIGRSFTCVLPSASTEEAVPEQFLLVAGHA
ncbi:hypothetical protein B0G77_8772 [Paraburkholderia sp. BL10I2N1]|nr:hypothetical protein B0G77_8772 [Paraburkholderia sp. BL10I2N1]